MKLLIVETSPISKNNKVTVHVRNSLILTDYLQKNGHDCRLVSEESDILDVSEQFDFIIFVSATFYFKFEIFVKLLDNQKNCKVGSILNEYELFINDFLKHRLDFLICNFEEWGVKKAHKHDKFLMSNLNALSARTANDPALCDKKYGCCYFGTWRKRREVYFKKYLINDMILSTSSKNIKKFQLSGCDCLLTDPFSWEIGNETMNLFKASLYIEDTASHDLFNHLANRLYEGLFSNCAVFFDVSCMNTIHKDVYILDSYFMVDGYDDLMQKVNNLDEDKVKEFVEINTAIALEQKTKTLGEIEEFLFVY